MGPPCCKPLRILQLISVTVGFCFLILLRKYDASYDTVINPSSLILFFTCFGSLVILMAADTFTQMVRQPISNISIGQVLITGAILCFISGIIAAVFRGQNSNSNALRTLNILSLLSAISFFSSVIFVIDIIVLVRYA